MLTYYYQSVACCLNDQIYPSPNTSLWTPMISILINFPHLPIFEHYITRYNFPEFIPVRTTYYLWLLKSLVIHCMIANSEEIYHPVRLVREGGPIINLPSAIGLLTLMYIQPNPVLQQTRLQILLLHWTGLQICCENTRTEAFINLSIYSQIWRYLKKLKTPKSISKILF
jgi:hypothetical protein